ncbi:peptide ABC transporter substrate-binding protein [Parendozoicomonas sp. Alg238-R29]|uniref:peptide ABC transporter substrate-binding protein n=1 Tax=Parendozoicomonas sp. Alg238-R29 TaxID=2993446 RepID=UPI00248DE502|nr:peptide ABC transporter substrate-binding protein [Parendozoicomonas sp. Alg238-R29]
MLFVRAVFIVLLFLSAVLQAGESIIRIGKISDPHTLNPFQILTSDSAALAENLFEGLIVPTPDGDVAPGQAESWKFENDGHRIVFTLRKGLRWSNGDPLTAQDFVAGFRYQGDPKNGFMMAIRLTMLRLVNIDKVMEGQLAPEHLGVSAPDDRTLVVELSQPVDHALYLLTNQYPLHKPTLKRYGEHWAKVGQMVVNGAYMPKSWLLNEKIELIRNPNYYDADKVRIERAELFPFSVDTELKQYEAGFLDMTYTVLPGRYEWLKKKFGSELKINPSAGTYLYTFNLDNPRFQSPCLRRALAYAIDRKMITEKITGYSMEHAISFAPAKTLGNSLPQGTPLAAMSQKRREAAARRLYRESGHGPENPLQVEILYNTMDSHRLIALAVADMWKRVLGVKASLRNVEWNSLEAVVKERKFDVVRTGWIMGHPNACFMYQIFHSDAPLNTSHYNSREFEQAFHHACYGNDPALRSQSLTQTEDILDQDMPAIPIYHYIGARLVRKRVQGYPAPDQYPVFRIQDLWFDQEK